MNLHSLGHRRGVAAAPHRNTAAAGHQIFAEGGNALEAMIAMAASIAAVYPHMNHIGGNRTDDPLEGAVRRLVARSVD